MVSIYSPVLPALALVAIVIATEYIAPVERYSLRARWRGLAFTCLNLLLGLTLLAGLLWLWSSLGLRPLATVPLTGLGAGLSVLGGLLIYDFLAYWHHRFQHRFMWPIHAVHHAQTELHVANNYAHFLERLGRFLFFTIPLSLVHFDAAATPFLIVVATGLLENYIHSPTSAHFGPLGRIFVDNRYHRIHHSIEARHFDKNFGILFSFWDRLFGTEYYPAAGEWPATGVDGHLPPRDVRDYLLYPLRFRAARLADDDAPAAADLAAQSHRRGHEIEADCQMGLVRDGLFLNSNARTAK